jgi:hypothetical protein
MGPVVSRILVGNGYNPPWKSGRLCRSYFSRYKAKKKNMVEIG